MNDTITTQNYVDPEFEAAFLAAHSKAEQVTEAPLERLRYVVNRYNTKKTDSGMEVGIQLYFPKYNVREWMNFGSKAAGVLKATISKMGADTTKGLIPALDSIVNRTGELDKSKTEVNDKGKQYARYSILSGEVQKANDDVPF